VEENKENTQVKKHNRDAWYMHLAEFIDKLMYSLFRSYRNKFDNAYISREKSQELATKVLLGINIVIMIVLIVLVSTIVSISKEKTIQVQVTESATPGFYTVGREKASKPYFDMIASGFVTKAANYTHLNIEEHVNSLLPSILPSTYTKVFTQVKENIQFVINNKVTQTYKIQSSEIIVKGSRAQVTFKGILNRRVGGIPTVKDKQFEIPVIIKIINYTPFIESFEFKYVGINKKDKSKDVALERQSEIDLRNKLIEERKKNKETAYKTRERERNLKAKGEF